MSRPLGSKNKNYIPLEVRLYSKVYNFTRNSCWEMKPPKHNRYPIIRMDNKDVRASRISWELHNKKKFPKGKFCLHKCDNTKCINPDHLFIGTHKQNMRDMIKKGRDRKDAPIGERCAQHVLKEFQVIQIRKILKNINSSIRGSDSRVHKILAKEYKVSTHTIYNIHKGITWKHL